MRSRSDSCLRAPTDIACTTSAQENSRLSNREWPRHGLPLRVVELIRTSCEQLDDIAKPIVKIKVKGKTTHFDVRIQLKSGGRLRDIEQTLQGHLRQNLTENLGIENLGQINIVASGFKSGRIQASSPITSKEQTAEPVLEIDESAEPNSTAALKETLEKKPL